MKTTILCIATICLTISMAMFNTFYWHIPLLTYLYFATSTVPLLILYKFATAKKDIHIYLAKYRVSIGPLPVKIYFYTRGKYTVNGRINAYHPKDCSKDFLFLCEHTEIRTIAFDMYIDQINQYILVHNHANNDWAAYKM